MEVYKTTVNAYKRLLENPANGEVCGVPTLVGTKTRKARVRATAVVESNGNSCKLLCMPHAGMASDVDVVRVAPGDGTVVGSGGVSIRTNAEHINSEFTSGGVKGRLVAAQLCVTNITSQANGVLYAACDQNRKDISGYEPVDIVTSIKEGNMVVASAQDEKVTVLYKPSQPEEIDEWVEDVQKGPYGGTRDINANSYPASHAVIWQGDNNTADYERPSGEQLTAYEEGTTVTLYDAGTSRSDLYLAGSSITRVDSTRTIKRSIGDYNNVVREYVSAGSLDYEDDTIKFAIFNGDWATQHDNASYWQWTDISGFNTGVVVDASADMTMICAFHTNLTVSQLSGKHFDHISGGASSGCVPLTGFRWADDAAYTFRVSCHPGTSADYGFIKDGICQFYDTTAARYRRNDGHGSSDAFAAVRAQSFGYKSAMMFMWFSFDIVHPNGTVVTSGSYTLKLRDFAKQGTVPVTVAGYERGNPNWTVVKNEFIDDNMVESVTELQSSSNVTQLGQQEVLTQQGAPVAVVQQPAQPFEYSAEIQTVNVPQRLLVEFDAVYEYSGEDVLTSVTANPMRGNKDILPRVHNNVFASPLSGNQRAYRRYDIDSARVGSTKRKSM